MVHKYCNESNGKFSNKNLSLKAGPLVLLYRSPGGLLKEDMKTRIIHTKIHFEDDWFNTLSIEYKYIFIYLFTNSDIGHTGIYQLPIRVALLETGATKKQWDEACKKFEKDKKVIFHENWVCVANSQKYTNYSGPKNESAYLKELESFPTEISTYFNDTLSVQYIYPMHTTINNKSKIINKKPKIENNKLDNKFLEKMRKEISEKLK